MVGLHKQHHVVGLHQQHHVVGRSTTTTQRGRFTTTVKYQMLGLDHKHVIGYNNNNIEKNILQNYEL